MKRILALAVYFFITESPAAVFTPSEIDILKQNFLANITQQGAVVASPSKFHPDYYYDWVRDSAIAMGLVETWYEEEKKPESKERLLNYVNWVKLTQHQADKLPNQDILGEPKFYLDGQAFEGPWGRPQNDGPALRSLTLIRFAQTLLDDNEDYYVQTNLYNGGLEPLTMGAIKMDLEYVAHHWQEKNYDLWEEVYGHHFFTSMVQKKALIEGAKLARRLDDYTAAAYYEREAHLLDKRLLQHMDNSTKLIQATLPPHPGPQKTLELDSAIMLGVLLGNTNEGAFVPENEFVQNTSVALKTQFKSLYPINTNYTQAVLFGRYPGDTYDGYGSEGLGNPWFILTATMAEYYYSLAQRVPDATKNQTLVNNYIKSGDQYLQLIKDYATDLYLSEQINLKTGMMQGAYSLTWSYVAVLRAISLREKLETPPSS